jgi:hypothetical protein
LYVPVAALAVCTAKLVPFCVGEIVTPAQVDGAAPVQESATEELLSPKSACTFPVKFTV